MLQQLGWGPSSVANNRNHLGTVCHTSLVPLDVSHVIIPIAKKISKIFLGSMKFFRPLPLELKFIMRTGPLVYSKISKSLTQVEVIHSTD